MEQVEKLEENHAKLSNLIREISSKVTSYLNDLTRLLQFLNLAEYRIWQCTADTKGSFKNKFFVFIN